MSKKWVVVSKGADYNRIAEKFGISPYMARVIRNREAVTDEEIDMFLNGKPEMMHDPALLKDMDKAAAVIEEAIEAQVAIRVVGDYDIDGVCASFILKKGLEAAGAVIDVRLPDRIKDGYGINEKIIKEANDDGIELIITCDNGIAAMHETELALSLGMSIVITDHHEVPYDLSDGRKRYRIPPADAVIDPKREDDSYPFPGICGAMVAYKLVSYIYDRCDIGQTVTNKDKLLTEFLSFAAFATIGDIMELRDENRIAVKYGLEILRNTDNKGMHALIEATGLSDGPILAHNVSFILGPCVNASGRLETADEALDLFLTDDADSALEKARELVRVNESRKNLTVAFSNKAVRMVEEQYPSDRVIVVYMPDCHESLAGIVAGRLKETFYRPSIVLTDDNSGGIKGSGRSIESYNMFEELSKVKELFTKFGGHAMAAGLSMPQGTADILRSRLNEACTLKDDDLVEKMHIDIPLPVGYINEQLVKEFERLEPYGVGNPRPLFAEKDVPVRSVSLLGNNKNVLKIIFEGRAKDGRMNVIEGVIFKDCERIYEMIKDRKSLSVLYRACFNDYNGRRTVQIQIDDFY